jgi:NAD(P)H-nitrite reductase large subunit
MAKKVIVIGASAAGIGFINTLHRLSADFQITCISREKEIPYNKCFLIDFVTNLKKESELEILNDSLKNQLMLGKSVIQINPSLQSIQLCDNKILEYDYLFLGMGSSAFMPKIPLIDSLQGIFSFHTIADAQNIKKYIQENSVKKAVVIGAGLSGLECADALNNLSVEVTVVEKNKQVLPWILSQNATEFLQLQMKKKNIQFLSESCLESIVHKNNKITGILLQDGRFLETDLLICATGVRQNLSLAINAGVKTDENGIITNEYMQTNYASIFAGGDLIGIKDPLTHKTMRSTLWPDAMLHGTLAAHALLNKPRPYAGSSIIASSSFFNLKFSSYGMQAHEYDKRIIKNENDTYQEYLIKNNHIIGFTLIGAALSNVPIKRAVLMRQPFTEINL